MSANMSYNKWKEGLVKNTEVAYNIYSLMLHMGGSESFQNLLHMTLVKGEEDKSGVVVQSNTMLFPRIYDNVEESFNYMVFDKEGELVYFTDALKNSQLFTAALTNDIVEINNKRYIVSKATFQSTEYTCVVVADYYEVLKTPGYIYLYFLFIALSTVVSILLLWYAIRRNYTFVDKIIESLSKNRENREIMGKNEIEFINRMILRIDDENLRFSKLILEQNIQLKSSYFSRLLKGWTNDTQAIQDGIRQALPLKMWRRKWRVCRETTDIWRIWRKSQRWCDPLSPPMWRRRT